MSYKYLKKYDPYLICCLEKSHAETVKYQKQIKQVKILNIYSLLPIMIEGVLCHEKDSSRFNLTFYDMNKHDQNKVIKVHIVTVTNPYSPLRDRM